MTDKAIDQIAEGIGDVMKAGFDEPKPIVTEAREVLVAARAIIAEPERWTQGAPAKVTQDGCLVPVYQADATCWCMTGAIELAWLRQNLDGKVKDKAEAAIWSVLFERAEINSCVIWGARRHIQLWNDNKERRHPEVLDLLDAAIEGIAV